MYRNAAIIGAIAVSASVVLLFSIIHANNVAKERTNSEETPSFPVAEFTDVKANPWEAREVQEGESAGQEPASERSVINESYDGIDSKEGVVVINDQSYFMTTLGGNLKSIVFNEPDGTAVRFAEVTFTFARPPNIPLPTNPEIPVSVQFADGTNEVLYVQVQPDRPMTVLSTHDGPRAGVTVTQGDHLMTGLAEDQGKVKILVSRADSS